MPIKLNGSTSGYTQVNAAAVAANNTLVLPTTGTTLLSDTFTGNVALTGNATITGNETVSGNVTVSGDLIPSSSFLRNRIINGNMVIDQRNAGAQITAANLTSGTYMVDRWFYQASQAAKFTAQQNAGAVTTAVGFPNYLGMTVATAVTVGASDYFCFSQCIEGFNFADFGFGTASAKTVTISFVVYSSLTGTFGAVLKNNTGTRSYPFTYSIPTANTWTTISVTVAGDTSGTWVGATNGIGAILQFGLGVGTTYSGTAGAWSATNYVSATGAVSVVGTASATFYITGVQLEVGSNATPFERRQYGEELLLCQRYYETGYNIWSGYTNGSSNYYFSTIYKVTKRTAATLSFSGTIGSGFPSTSPTVGLTDTQQFRADPTSNGVSTAGYYQFNYAASAEL